MGRNDAPNVVREGQLKNKGRFELKETSAECSWDLDPLLAEYANTYIANFVSNQTLINVIIPFNPVWEKIFLSR